MNLEGLMPKNIKTASHEQAGAAPSSKVAQAVADAAASVSRSHTKVASVTPVDAIEKLASDVVSQDAEASIKTAHLVGAAMADGFMSQLGMYEKVAAQISEKTASVSMSGLDPSTVELVKIAQEDPQAFLSLVKEAAGEEEALLKQAEDETAAQLERDILYKSAEHYVAGYEVGLMMVTG
jgi:hypothetical protein